MERTNNLEKSQFGLPDIGIPAEVLFHPELTPTEKILFGFIRNLSLGEKGCWASNRYLGNLIGTKSWTISRAVSNLETNQFILVKHPTNNGKQTRHIYINPKYQALYRELVTAVHQRLNEYNGFEPLVKFQKGDSEKSLHPICFFTSKKEKEKEKEKDISLTWKTLSKKYGRRVVQFTKKYLTQQKKRWPQFIKEEITPDSSRVLSSVDTLDKLCRLDGYDFETEIKPVLSRIPDDDFWSRNVLSFGSLRQKGKNGETKFTNIQTTLSIRKNGNEQETNPDLLIKAQRWSPEEEKVLKKSLFEPVWKMIGKDRGDQIEVTQTIIETLGWLKTAQKRPDYSSPGKIPPPGNPLRSAYDRWAIVPKPEGLLIKYLDWLSNQPWITHIQPGNFDPEGKTFKIFLRDYQKDLGVDVFTGRSI